MSQDDGEGQDEVYAAFEALGGPLTWDEFARLMGSGRYPAALMQQVTILMSGDAAAAEVAVFHGI